MKANELRIGNYINGVLVNGTYTVDIWALRIIQEGNFQNSYNTDLKVFEPIPLTEQWFLKFGFYKNIDTLLFEKSGFQIDLSVLKCHFYLPSFGDWYKEIEYVHQLQNLYFALTGEELTQKQL